MPVANQAPYISQPSQPIKMHMSSLRRSQAYIERVSVKCLVQQFDTPLYVYSKRAIVNNWRSFLVPKVQALICYAVKANSNLAILQQFAALGAGFDIVSRGELERVLQVSPKVPPIIFSGVGKQVHEIKRALEVGIFCFNVESEQELCLIQNLAKQMKKIAQVALRINPDVSAKTHPFIATGLKENKFGIPIRHAFPLYLKASTLSHIKIMGVACHIGSQITSITPFLSALEKMLTLVTQLNKHNVRLSHIDLGGGIGIQYKKTDKLLSIKNYLSKIHQRIKPYGLQLILAPGRALIGNAGTLLTRVDTLKINGRKNFAVVDAGMTELLRPALYEAWHPIASTHASGSAPKIYDIVGPVCESADFLGLKRKLCLKVGDILRVENAGAYGFSLSSNYNSRRKPAEVLVDGQDVTLIRRRESYEDLWMHENV